MQNVKQFYSHYSSLLSQKNALTLITHKDFPSSLFCMFLFVYSIQQWIIYVAFYGSLMLLILFHNLNKLKKRFNKR